MSPTDLGHVLDVTRWPELEHAVNTAAICEMVTGVFYETPLGVIPSTLPHDVCQRPADWIVRSLCTCGHHAVQLLCTPHVENAQIERQCPACGNYDQFVARNSERIR